MKKIDVNLTKSEEKYLKNFTKKGKVKAVEYQRAYILLNLHQGISQEFIITIFSVSSTTIWRLKKKYIELGLKEALKDNERSGQPIKYKKEQEAEIIATACTSAPVGRNRWTLELLKEHVKDKPGLRNINRESIRLILKKTNISLG